MDFDNEDHKAVLFERLSEVLQEKLKENAEKFRDQLGIDGKGISLEVLSDKLEINNPEAHRALADAITTAKVFLKLKELDISNSPESIDDLISDIDSWL